MGWIARVALCAAVAVLALLGTQVGVEAKPQLLVSSAANSRIIRYDGATGDYITTFASGGPLDYPYGLASGPDGNVYVADWSTNEVLRYDWLTRGFIDSFADVAGPGWLYRPSFLTFGPDDNLYVGKTAGDWIKRYDGSTGAYMGVFASGSGLDWPLGLTFGPDDNLYASSSQTDQVLRYDGVTGAFVDVFASGGGLDAPAGLAFGPDGDLYVGSSLTDSILRYDGTTGAPLGTFASGGGLDSPVGMAFGPDDNLYVSSRNTDQVLRYDGATGAFVDVFASGSGLDSPLGLLFMPNPEPMPILPGYGVSLYAEDVTLTGDLSFEDGGECFAANGNNQVPCQISLIPAGGGSASPFGPLVSDPDAVLVAEGGGVYVGGGNTVYWMSRDGNTMTPLSTGGLLSNVSCLKYDPNGDLLASSLFNGTITRIAPDGSQSLAYETDLPEIVTFSFDRDGQLYVGTRQRAVLYRYVSDGVLDTVVVLDDADVHGIVFDEFNRMYAVDQGGLYAVDPGEGTATLAVRLDQSGGLTFNEGAIYLSEGHNHEVWRVGLPSPFPIADANGPYLVVLDETGVPLPGYESITLDGSGSLPPPGGSLINYLWQVGALGHDAGAAALTSLTWPELGSVFGITAVGTYSLSLTVTAGGTPVFTDTDYTTITVSMIPEPATCLLMLSGIAGLAARRRRQLGEG